MLFLKFKEQNLIGSKGDDSNHELLPLNSHNWKKWSQILLYHYSLNFPLFENSMGTANYYNLFWVVFSKWKNFFNGNLLMSLLLELRRIVYHYLVVYLYCETFIYFCFFKIIIFFIYPSEFSPSALADDLSLWFELQQVSSSFQDSFQYSGRSQ